VILRHRRRYGDMYLAGEDASAVGTGTVGNRLRHGAHATLDVRPHTTLSHDVTHHVMDQHVTALQHNIRHLLSPITSAPADSQFYFIFIFFSTQALTVQSALERSRRSRDSRPLAHELISSGVTQATAISSLNIIRNSYSLQNMQSTLCIVLLLRNVSLDL